MTILYDSTSAGDIPLEAELVGAYVDGRFPTKTAATDRFGAEKLVLITVTGIQNVRVCDCEKGDLSPATAARWASIELGDGRRPTIYTSLGNLGAVYAALKELGHGPADVDWWVADWTGKPHLVPGSVATQFADPATSGGHFDLSLTNGIWPGAVPSPAPAPGPPQSSGEVNVQVSTLKPGAKGGEVKAVQGILNAKAGARLSIDGLFGPSTETAVKAWQHFFGLAVDGIVGAETWSTLVGG